MTIKQLSRLYYLNIEIKRDTARLEELRARATNMAQTITGMPRVPGVTDKVGMFAAEIADLENFIEQKIQRCVAERARLERYIAGIPDDRTRLIFTMRFVDGLTYGGIADVMGAGNTAGAIKQTLWRYLKNS
jgi:DNA-directed RNA polymerase specialized sigma24 family protein